MTNQPNKYSTYATVPESPQSYPQVAQTKNRLSPSHIRSEKTAWGDSRNSPAR